MFAGPFFVVVTSAESETWELVVALLLARLGSDTPAGKVTDVVLLTVPVALLATIPLTVTTILLPTPALRLILLRDIEPIPDAVLAATVVSQSALPTMAHDHAIEAIPGGNKSVSVAPTTFDGPLLVNSIWYCTAWPGVKLPLGVSFTLVTWRSAVGAKVVVTVLLLFAGVGSTVPIGNVRAAVLLMAPVAAAAKVPLIVMVTLLLAGKVATVPLTALPAMATLLGQIAPLVADPQLAVNPLICELTLSRKLVPFALLGPALLISNV
jgi:hypothetical protein